MNFKYTSIILLGLYSSVSCYVTEEDVHKWFDALVEKHGHECRQYISDESWQLLHDDFEADNEEIRAFHICLAFLRKYIEDRTLNVDLMLNEFRFIATGMTDEEAQLAMRMMNNCKEEGEQEMEPKDVMGKFTGCVIDRCKSGI